MTREGQTGGFGFVRSALAAGFVLAAALPASAGAATIAPDTALETASDKDCTLREAIQSMNLARAQDACVNTGAAFGTNDTVALAAGTIYSVSLAGGGEDENVGGDLDVAVDLTITGDASDPPVIRGDVKEGDRVLDAVNPTDLTLKSLVVDDGEITSGAVKRGGNILYGGGPGDKLILDQVTVKSGLVNVGAGGGESGGGISAEDGGEVVIRNGSLVSGNVSGSSSGNSSFGGGVHIGGSGTDLTVADSTVSQNDAGVGNDATAGLGGGIHIATSGSSTIAITDSTIDGNRAGGVTATDGEGGGIALRDSNSATVTITRGSISDNVAGGNVAAGAGGAGGGVYIEDVNAPVNLDGVTVSGNQAGGKGGSSLGTGGGIHSFNDLEITGGAISSNHAGVGPGATGEGGGIYIGSGADLDLDGTKVSQNQVGAGNGAGLGGGVAMRSQGALTVNRATIADNTATGSGGGGIFRDGGKGALDTVAQTTISGNRADSGGGLFVGSNHPVLVSQSTINSNRAAGGSRDGGGIFTRSNLTLSNSTIYSNDALGSGGEGGGVFSDDTGAAPLVVLNHATVASNSSTESGGNLFFEGPASSEAAQIRASIVAAGTSANFPASANCFEESADVIRSNGFNVEQATDQCSFGATGDVNSAVSAGLGALGANGGPTQTAPLLLGSTAIDRVTGGCPPTPAVDQRGSSRPQGPACDSGAFELVYRTLTVSTAGTGTVTGTGISCPGDCTQEVPQGTQIALTATPAAGGSFNAWSGACEGSGACNVTLDADKSVTATFANPPPADPPAAKPPAAKKCKKGFKKVKGKCKRSKKSKKK